MKRRISNAISILLSLLATGTVVAAQEGGQCTDDAMLVFDGSGSMAEMGFNGLDLPRIVEARNAVNRVLPEVASLRRIGLVIYGPGKEESCKNISLRFGPVANAAPRIQKEINELDPLGQTPLTDSVRIAAEALEYRDKPGVIVLVTDGKETCGGGTCLLAAKLSAESLALTIHVIGFQVRGDFFAWRSQRPQEYDNGRTVARCLADITGGHYFSTETADELAAAMNKTLGCAVIGSRDAVNRKKYLS